MPQPAYMILFNPHITVRKLVLLSSLLYPWGNWGRNSSGFDSGPADSCLSVYPLRSRWRWNTTCAWNNQLKLWTLPPHSEQIELFRVLGSCGPSLKQEKCVLITKGLKKRKRKKTQPSWGKFPQGKESLYDLLCPRSSELTQLSSKSVPLITKLEPYC